MKRALSIFFLSAMSLAFLGARLQAQCVYTIQMHDSYGDGWNGGYITVNGTTYTCSGSATTATVTLTHGVSASFVWTSGSWVSEVSYSILDPNGTVVYSVSSPSNGQTFTVTPYCVEEDESGYVVIGSGTSTNYNLPSYIYRAYAMSEQIYTAEEIGEVGDITSISYYDNSSNTATRSVDIYMMTTDHQTFSSTSDWIVPTVSDRVFSGSVTFRHGWVKIELDEPFYYDGTGNLLVVFDDNTGSSTTSHPFYTYSTGEYRAIYTGGSYNVSISSLPPSSYTDLSRTSSNNQIRLEIGPHQVDVGSGNSTASYIPTYTCSRYTLSEQIFTASEIGNEAALIKSISFNASSTSSSTNNNRDWTIYLKNVGSQTTFSGASSWLDLEDATMVYAGTVDCRSNGWVTVTFDEPFYFNGHDNVAVIVDDNTGTTACTNYWRVDSKSNAAIYYYGSTNANPTSPSVSGSLYGYRNQVRFGLEYPEVLPDPTLANPVVTGNTTVPCGGTAVLTASGVVSDNEADISYLWYDDPDGLVLLHVGDTFDVTNITTDRTVYVRAVNGVDADPEDFSYTGAAQTYTVPNGVTQVRLQVWGAQGGSYSSSYPGGKGGYSAGTLSVTGGQELQVNVGGHPTDYSTSSGTSNPGGWNGGGSGKTYYYSSTYTYSLGGGGATDIRVNGTSLNNRVIVAGGGSGGSNRGSGNYGGGSTSGYYSGSYGSSNVRATQSAYGTNGGFGQGANAVASYNYRYGPAGGGGGWYGGGSYSSSSDSYSEYSRYTGGGSGYVNTSSSYHPSGYLLNSSGYYLTNTTLAAGNTSFESPTGGNETGHQGNGFARITPIVPENYSVSELVPVTIHFTAPQTPVIVSSPSCQGENVTVSVEDPVEGLTYGWFTSSDCNANSLIHEGTEYTTSLNTTTTLYVRSYSGTLDDPSDMVYNFTYSGAEEEFTVPAGVTQVKLEVWGAQGGTGYNSSSVGSVGGKGGYAAGTLAVIPGQTLYVNVGGQGSSAQASSSSYTCSGGYNGGGNSGTHQYTSSYYQGAGGGGATHIATRSGLLNTLNSQKPSVLIVAGGGGGGSYSSSYTGGYGGGQTGGQYSTGSYYGQGATQDAGGNGSSYGSGDGAAGTFGRGGNGGTYSGGGGGAGGGGGWYGGGGGRAGHYSSCYPGGGGSGHIGTGVTSLAFYGGNNTFTSPSGGSETGHSGNGYARITAMAVAAPACLSDIVSITLTPYPVPTASLSASAYSACNQETINLYPSSNSDVTYTWSDGVNVEGTSYTVTPGYTTTYTVTATNSYGCTASASTTITVDAPSVSLSVTESECIDAGDAVTLQVQGAGSLATTAAGYGFSVSRGQWQSITGTSALTGDDNTATYSLPFNFYYCGTNFSSITYTTNGYIYFGGNSNYQIRPFRADLYANQTYYRTDGTAPNRVYTIQFYGRRYGGSEYFYFQVKLHETTNQIDFVYGPGFTSLTSSSYYIDIYGPTTSSRLAVIPTSGNGTASTSTSAYSLSNTQVRYLTSGTTYTFTPGSLIDYVWSTGATSQSITVNPESTTTYTVTASSDDYNCDAILSRTVTVKPIIEISSEPESVCSGSSSVLTATGADSYLWNNGATTTSITTPALTATVAYTVTGTTDDGCSSTGEVTVTVPVFSAGTVSGSASICQSATTPYTISSVTAGVGGGTTEYRWYRNGALLTNSNTEEYEISVSDINGMAPGTYTYTREFKDGCANTWVASTGSFTLTVNAALDQPTVTGNREVVCGGGTSLTAGGVSGENISYCWYADPEATQLLHQGAEFTPERIVSDTTFYVRTISMTPSPQSRNFSYTGSPATFIVPDGSSEVTLEVWGAQGGTYSSSYPGGKGGYSRGTLSVTPGDQLYVYVGGQANGNTGGYNGGGAGKTYSYNYTTYSYGGGGATDIRVNGSSLNNRVIVAGGGSGGTSRGSGNYGGGTTGGYYSQSSLSGTQSSAGSNGSFGVGANAVASDYYNYGPGGGGGGWYGGGSYSSSSDGTSAYSRYSGGGSGYVNTASSYHPSGYLLNSSEYYLTNTTLAAGNTSFTSPSGGTETGHTGNGYARINYTVLEETGCPSILLPVEVTVEEPTIPIINVPASCEGNEITLTIDNPNPGLTYGWFTSADCNANSLVNEGTEYTIQAGANTLYVRSYVAGADTLVYNFSMTESEQTYTVESGVQEAILEVWGAQGGFYPGYSSRGGKGGYSIGTLQVTPGETLHVYVGESGSSANGYAAYNGGGGYYNNRNSYCSGGGATDIRVGGNTLYDRIIVAGGGGGQSYYSGTSYTSYWMTGGVGGGTSGTVGNYYSYRRGGYQGTATSGGNGYSYTVTYGQFGQGGSYYGYSSYYANGGGGGGWYGGGGGGYTSTSYSYLTAGGGGSGYVWTAATASNAPSNYNVSASRYLSDAHTYAGNTSFLSPSGTTETGHTGNGYARIRAIRNLGAGCLSPIATVNVPAPDPVPSVTLVASQNTACNQETINLYPSSNSDVTYTWSDGVNVEGTSYTVTPGYTTTYTVTATNTYGCTASANTTITVDAPSVSVSVTESECIDAGDAVTLQVQSSSSQATSAADYRFTASLGQWQAITGTSGQTGDDYSATYSLPFTFYYCGTNFSSITYSTNGYIYFGGNSNYEIRPFNADLYANQTYYRTDGTSPNRVFTIQFYGRRYGQSQYFYYQVKLHETTNQIDFVYGPGYTALSSSGYYIDIYGPNTSNRLAVIPTSGNGTANTTNSSYNLSTTQVRYLTSGTTYTFTPGSAIDYVWNTGATTESITVNPETTTTYTVTASSDDYSCDAVLSQTVTIKPIVEITSEPEAVCSGESAVLTVTGAESYVWTSSEPIANGNGYYIADELCTTDIYTTPGLTEPTTYYVVGTSIDGCYDTASYTIQVPTFTVGSVYGSAQICQSETTPITTMGVDATGGGDTGYRWKRDGQILPNSDINNYVISTAELASLTEGTYTYTREFHDGCGHDWTPSSGSFTISIEEGLDQPVVNGNVNLACGSSTTLVASGVQGLNEVTYRWYSDPEGRNLIAESAEIEFSNLVSDTTVYVQAIDSVAGGQVTNIPYSGGIATYVTPQNATQLILEVWGAQGGTYSTAGGKGGYSIGTMQATPGQNLYVYVGGQGNGSSSSGGFNGGGNSNSYGGSGGGSTDISTQMVSSIYSNTHYYSRIIVAGGGGGAGFSSTTGGYGGGLSGGRGGDGSSTGGYGGTQTSGGSNHAAGLFGTASRSNSNNGGGGGGGWYGGASGVSAGTDAGGGGGSGYVYTSSTASNYPSGCLLNSSYYLTDAATYAGNTSFPAPGGGTETGHTGNGYARITAVIDLPASCPSILLPVTVHVSDPVAPQIEITEGSNNIPCGSALTMSVVAPNEELDYVWSTDPLGENIVHTGDTYSPILSENTTFYVSSKLSGGSACQSPMSEPVAITVTDPQAPAVENVEVTCGQDVVLEVQNPNSAYTYNWYDDAVCTNLVHTGTSWTLSYLNSDTVFYVKSMRGSAVSGGPVDFNYTGNVQTWTVPAGVNQVQLEVWGAQGGDSQGHLSTYRSSTGGYSTGVLNVSAGTTLYVQVGGAGVSSSTAAGGYNGGGDAITTNGRTTNSGGGATDIRIGQNSLYARVIVAGGGGGGRDAGNQSNLQNYFGAGGGSEGLGGTSYNSSSLGATRAGRPGTQTAGGAAGVVNNSETLTAGTFGYGGYARSSTYGEGGGGGWYGGGPGSADASAGGGSGYVYTSATASNYPSGCLLNSSYYLSDAQTIAGNTSFPAPNGGTEIGHSGNGFARITYNVVPLSCESPVATVHVTVHALATPVLASANVDCGTPSSLSIDNVLPGVVYNWYRDSECTDLLLHNQTALDTMLFHDATIYVQGLGSLLPSQNMVETYEYTGAPQTFIVPSGVNSVTMEVWGAEGGGSRLSGNSSSGLGGLGGYSIGTLAVTPGQTLTLYVGGRGQSSTSGRANGGWNGGGSGYASSSGEPGNGGGGATDIRVNGTTLNHRVIVAGGGGGGGEDSGDSHGHGGGLSATGYNTTYDATQTAPGSGGSFGQGGSTNYGDGGGGGGGWYGGGTLSQSSTGSDTEGGGGGSGYVNTASSAHPSGYALNDDQYYLTNASTIAGNGNVPAMTDAQGNTVNTNGNGFIRISYNLPGGYACKTAVTSADIEVTPITSIDSGMAMIVPYTDQTLLDICEGDEIQFIAYDNPDIPAQAYYNVMWLDENKEYIGWSNMQEIFNTGLTRPSDYYTFYALAATNLLSEAGTNTLSLPEPDQSNLGVYNDGIIFSVTAHENMTVDSLAFYPNGGMNNAPVYVYYKQGACSAAAANQNGWTLDGGEAKILNLVEGQLKQFPLSAPISMVPGDVYTFFIAAPGTSVRVRREPGFTVDAIYRRSNDNLVDVNCGYGVRVRTNSNPISDYELLVTSENEMERLFMGSLTYTLNGNTRFGCMAKDTTPVVFYVETPSLPVDSIAATDSIICIGQGGVTLTAWGGEQGISAMYEWTTGSCDGPVLTDEYSNPLTDAVISVEPQTTTTYFVKFTSPVCGETSCASKTIYVYDMPVIDNLVLPEHICAANALGIQTPHIDRGNTPAPIIARGWEITPDPNSAPFTEFADSLNVSESYNSYYVRYFVQISCITSYSDTVQIFVDSIPEIEPLSMVEKLCAEETIDWDGFLPAIDYHNGSNSDISEGWIVRLNNENQPVDDLDELVYVPGDDIHVQYSVTNACGTTVTPEYSIQVIGPPIITSDIENSEVCAGQPVNIQHPEVEWFSDSVDSYWEYTAISGGTNYTRLNVDEPVTYAMNNNFFRYIVVNTCGSDTSNLVQLRVTDIPHIADITAPETMCSGSVLAIEEPEVTDDGGLVLLSHSWFLSDEADATDNDLIAVDSMVYADSWNGHTAWDGRWLRYGVENQCGMGYSNAVQVTVHPDLHLTVSPADTSACYGPDYTIRAISETSIADIQYHWTCSAGGHLNGDTLNATVTATKPAIGLQTYTVDATDPATQCQSTATSQFDIFAIGIDTNILVCADELPYYYDPIAYPDFACDSAGTYYIAYVTDGGCDSVVTLHLEVNKPIERWTRLHYCAHPAVGYTWPVNGRTYGDITVEDSAYYEEVHIPSTTVKSDVTGEFCDSIVFYLDFIISNEPFIVPTEIITVPVGQEVTADIEVNMDCDECIARAAIVYELYKDGERINLMDSSGTVAIATYYADNERSYGIQLENGSGEIPTTTYNMYNYQYDFFYMNFLRNALSTVTATWNEPGEYRLALKLVRKTWETGYDFPYTYNQTQILGGAGSAPTDTVFSTDTIIFHVGEVDTIDMTNVTVCASDLPYEFHGNFYDEAGVYYAATENGDDTYVMNGLTLEVTEPVYYDRAISTCSNIYQGYSSDTILYDKLTSVRTGCDSIVRTYLRLNADNYSETDYVTACGEYTWNNSILTESGVYADTVVPGTDCDTAFYILDLTITNDVTVDTTIIITETQFPYTFEGNTYDQAGEYDIVYETAYSCDSILHLNLVMATTDIVITENEGAEQLGDQADYTITVGGGGLDDLKVALDYEVTRNGEVVDNVENYGSIYFETEYAQINQWFGRNLTAGSGSIPFNTFLVIFYQYDYFYLNFLSQAQSHVIASWHEPGEYKIKFTLRERLDGHDFPLTYDAENHKLGGAGATDGGVLALDSIMFHYDAPEVSMSVDTTICSAELPFNYQDSVFTEAVTDSVIHFSDAYGVYDTIVTLTLHVNQTPEPVEYEALVCEGADYEDEYFTLTADEIAETAVPTNNDGNVAEFTLNTTAANGCDSVVTLTLYVKPTPAVTLTTALSVSTFCEEADVAMVAGGAQRYEWYTTVSDDDPVLADNVTGDSWTFPATENVTVGVTGYTEYTLGAETLECSAEASYAITVVAGDSTAEFTGEVCQGEEWSNDYFNITSDHTSEPGTYEETVVTGSSDCGTYYAHLVLTVHPVYNDEFGYVEVYDEVCENASYSGNGFELTAEEIAEAAFGDDIAVFYAEGETESGCDSIVELTLTINPTVYTDTTIHVCENANAAIYEIASEQLLIQLPVENATHEYTYQSASGCDSIVSISVVVDMMPNIGVEGNTALCANEDLRLDAYPLDNTLIDSLRWTDGQEVLSTDNTLELSSEDVPEEVVLISYSGTCIATQEFSITVSAPAVEIDTAICSYETYVAPQDAAYDEQTNTYTWTAQGMNGDCDTAYTVHVTVAQAPTRTFGARVAITDLPYVCYGEEFYAEGSYEIIVPNDNSCDSIVTLRLMVYYPSGTSVDPFMMITPDANDANSYILQAYHSENGDPEEKVSIVYNIYKDNILVDIVEDECGGPIEIGTEFGGTIYSRSLYNGTGSIPTNTFVLGSNHYDYFYFYFLNGRQNVITHSFTEPGTYEIVFQLMTETDGVDMNSQFNYQGQMRLIGGKNSNDNTVLATQSLTFTITDEASEDDETIEGTPTLTLSANNLSDLSSTVDLTCTAGDLAGDTKVAVNYTIYVDDEPIEYLSDYASRVYFSTYWPYQNRYVGKVITSATGSIPARTFAPSSNYAYNYFYMDFLANTTNQIEVAWALPGNYKIAFDLVEMENGVEFPLTWNGTDRIGGKGATQTTVLATDTLYYSVGSQSANPAPTGIAENGGASAFGIGLYPNPAKEFTTLTLTKVTESTVVTITDINGKLMAQYKPTDLRVEIGVATWAQGVYFVTVRDESSVETQKLIIAK